MAQDMNVDLKQRDRNLIRVAPWGAALAVALLVLGGCAQVAKYRDHHGAVVERAPASAPSTRVSVGSAYDAESPSLATIIDRQLQHGHYREGARQLRGYLKTHPDDRLARMMLQQAEADPRQWLGRASQSHVVVAGDSYSTLARRYLGDARLFVILARYNGSGDPSHLLAGQTVQLPANAVGMPPPDEAAKLAPPAPETAAIPVPERTVTSSQLQHESIAMLDAGQATQALSRIDQALALDPGLNSASGDSDALRKQLIAACHQRAIVLYRDQRLDPAIALWDRVLIIEPGYEPAVAYRARAMELKRRLKQY